MELDQASEAWLVTTCHEDSFGKPQTLKLIPLRGIYEQWLIYSLVLVYLNTCCLTIDTIMKWNFGSVMAKVVWIVARGLFLASEALTFLVFGVVNKNKPRGSLPPIDDPILLCSAISLASRIRDKEVLYKILKVK
jgi:hypothetical protein